MTTLAARLSGALLLAAVAACGGDNGGSGPGQGTLTIAKEPTASGDAQTGTVGAALANSLRVLVTRDGAPVEGQTVSWASSATGAAFTPATSTTNASGIASTSWTLGETAGAQSATASLDGASGSPVTFTATAAPGAAASFTKEAGDNQTGTVGTALGEPFRARLADEFGNGIAGEAVDWAIGTDNTGGAQLSAASTSTNSLGSATVGLTLGPNPGTVTVTASTGIFPALTFTATATSQSSGSAVTVQNDQFSPSSISVTAGTTVTWTWASGALDHNISPDDGSTPARSGSPTNAPASYQFTFNTPGTYHYHCEVHGAPGGSGMSGTVVVTP